MRQNIFRMKDDFKKDFSHFYKIHYSSITICKNLVILIFVDHKSNYVVQLIILQTFFMTNRTLNNDKSIVNTLVLQGG